MDALTNISDELTETDEGFVPVADIPVVGTPTLVAVTTLTTPTIVG